MEAGGINMEPLFTGLCTAMVTPFRLDYINIDLFDILLERQIRAGAAAVVVCGTTGESATMTDYEKTDLISHAVKKAAGRCKVIAGTGSNCTSHAIELSLAAQEAGADGLLLVSPYYNKASSQGLILHYGKIADVVSIPCIIYNVPSRTGTDIPVQVCKELSQHHNICGIKEAGGNISKVARIRQICGDDFSIWSGNDDMVVPIMALGGKGVISVVSNLYPETMKALTDLCKNGHYKEAGTLQCSLMSIIDVLFSEVNPIPIKAALRLIGYDVGHPRLPLTDLSTEKANQLKKILKQA